MGKVYLALDTKLDRDVAVKVLPASLAADSELMLRLQREAKTLTLMRRIRPLCRGLIYVEETSRCYGA